MREIEEFFKDIQTTQRRNEVDGVISTVEVAYSGIAVGVLISIISAVEIYWLLERAYYNKDTVIAFAFPALAGYFVYHLFNSMAVIAGGVARLRAIDRSKIKLETIGK